MPPQIKHDLNRSGWEATDFPSVCETCLPDNPFVKMLKEDYGAECKLCTRPFTVFSWTVDRARVRRKRTNICLTCARLKNACQSCIMDLQFGLPIIIRDKALEMVAPGPNSEINREYFAQNNEKAIEEGRAGVEQYEKADDKARELLRRLAQSKPYFRKGQPIEEAPASPSADGPRSNVTIAAGSGGPGPIRTRDSRAAAAAASNPRARGKRAGNSHPHLLSPEPKDWMPPSDQAIMSLFVTGIEDDLPEFKIRDFFKVYGKIKSLVVSHMSHCAFVNFESREAAEKAAEACQGRAVIAGCPLRIRWGQPRAIGTMKREERTEMIRDGRSAFPEARKTIHQVSVESSSLGSGAYGEIPHDETVNSVVVAPPGAPDVPYASLAGD